MNSYLPTGPHYKIQLPNWRYENTQIVMGVKFDGFCVGLRYHVILSKDVPGEPGWHFSVRPWCSQQYGKYPTVKLKEEIWRPDVPALEAKLGIKLEFLFIRNGVFHFHEAGK